MEGRTIAAIATPTGRGGIGVIRLSGIDSLKISSNVFIFPNTRINKKIKSHHVHYGFIIDEQSFIIDEVLFIYMKAPLSYTAEDVVEIQSHSSPVVLRKILDILIKNGAELADPGEFTKRAFLNGRIDLTQAEAVIDVINARTSTSLDLAVTNIRGNLKEEIISIINTFQKLLAGIGAEIDFPDDVGEDIVDDEQYIEMINNEIIQKLRVLKNNFNNSNIFRDGISAVIAGPPNSGKSSLINALLNKEKSIVTSIPGTTRDIIDDLINIDGIPFIITDTAGIQDTNDPVEKIGINKAIEKIDNSDLIIIMLDSTSELSNKDEFNIHSIVEKHYKNKNIIIVENKIDLLSEGVKSSIKLKPDIRMSIINNSGINELKNKISEIIMEDLPDNKNSVVPNLRHYKLIDNTLHNLDRVINGLKSGLSYEFISIEIKESIDNLREIIGDTKRMEILDDIFSNFCIGK